MHINQYKVIKEWWTEDNHHFRKDEIYDGFTVLVMGKHVLLVNIEDDRFIRVAIDFFERVRIM